MSTYVQGLTLAARVAMVKTAIERAEAPDQLRLIMSRAQGLRDELDTAYHENGQREALQEHKALLHAYFDRLEALTDKPVVGPA